MSGDLRDKWRLLGAIIGDPELSRADIVTAQYLIEGINSKTGIFYVSRPRLATGTRQSERNAMRCVDRLAARGYFDVTESGGRGNSQTFRPLYEAAEKATAVSPFTSAKRATLVSEKRRQRRPEKATAVSEKGDSGVSPTLLHVPASCTRFSVSEGSQPSLKSDARDDELWAAQEADRRAQAEEAKFPHAKPRAQRATEHRQESATAETEEVAPSQSPPPCASPAAGGFVVTMLHKGHPLTEHAPVQRLDDALALIDSELRMGFPGGPRWAIELRGPDGALIPLQLTQEPEEGGPPYVRRQAG